MGDFMKLFRRHKSTSKHEEEPYNVFETNQPNSETSVSSRSVDLHSTHDDDSYVANETLDKISEERVDGGLKEPRGWRKSFRKLRWKKKERDVSFSSENIAQIPATSSENINQSSTPVRSPSRVNKRWSYSPDLCEENVPGAKELRGTLERKLSVKLEAEERFLNERSPQNFQRFSDAQTKNISEQAPSVESSVYKASGSPISSRSSYAQSGSMSVTSFPTSLDITHSLNKMAALSQSEPVFERQHEHLRVPEKGNSSPGLTDWKTTECDRQRYEHVPQKPAAHKEYEQHRPTYQKLASGEHSNEVQNYNPQYSAEETPEEEEEPFGLQDIEEVLGVSDSRSDTLRSLHGQNLNPYPGPSVPLTPEQNALNSVTGSLMRGRTGTEFERAAEIALENYDYAPVDHYYQDLNQGSSNKYEADSSGNELRTPDTDDDIYVTYDLNTKPSRWDSQEIDFFTDSEEEDNGEDEVDSGALDKSESKSDSDQKSDRFSKDIGKFKFWERSSGKKRASPSKNIEAETSTFLRVDLSKQHQMAQLPEKVPCNLDKNQIKRRKIVASIISSEGAYIESLQRLETDYKQALLESKVQIIPTDVVEKIFYKIDSILQCHQLFHVALASSTANWDDHELIGGTFVASFSNAMVFECYGDFINNFTSAMDTVRKTCIRKPQFLAFLKERQAESQDRLNLYGLMLKPVQRFPQFIMFVQDLLKHTPPNHPDHLPLQLALTELETLADRLNHKKAETEDAADLRNLMENRTLKIGTHTKDGRIRKLVKQAELRECEYNEENLIEKMKDCLLVLTNDMLICCSINNRRNYQKSGTSTSKDLYKLKWRVGLDVVEVIDGSARPSGIEERETLTADFIALQQIAKLVSKLQLHYEGISSQIIEKSIGSLETKIRQAEQHASQPENSSFTIKFPGKSETIQRTLVTKYPSQKDEWLETISKSKLANSPVNLDAWFWSENLGSGSDWNSPLFLRSLSAHLSYETLQVQCAHAFMPVSHVTLLWLSCAASTDQSIVSVYYITEDRVEKVHVMQVESSVECIHHWNCNRDGVSVWLGMGSACLLEYSTSNGNYKKMSDVAMPTMSSVMIMQAYESNLYVGLLDGTLAMYTRPPGTYELNYISSVTVGTGPLKCLSPHEDILWGCSGNCVVTIDVKTFQPESSRSLVMNGENLVVNLVTRVGNGLWVNFCEECNIFLYHLESLQRLQEVNLSRVVRDFVQSLEAHEQIEEHCYVTSLCNGHSQLYVGMSNGLMLVMPLPKLPGSVPKITGLIKISRHALRSPLTFLFAPSLPPPKRAEENEDEQDVVDSPPVFETPNDLPPPLPKRDDLDKTIVPDPPSDNNDNYMKIRSSPAPTSGHPPLAMSMSNPKSPPIPPRPGVLPLERIIDGMNEILPEDKMVYENMTLQSIESPRKLTFVHWRDEAKTRQCPVLIACGEGYQNYGRKTSKPSPTSQDAPTIACWKIV